MQRILISIIFIISTFQCFAQQEKIHLVKGVRGEYSVILALSDVTGREALQLAREDAKRKALEKVCGSRVNIWDQMESSSAGDVFNSLSISQTEGEILEFNIVEEGHKQSELRSSETIFYCVADVRVKKGREPDPDFFIAVNGLKSVYYSGEELLFEVKPYRDCYMKIFLLENESVGYLLYPNEYDKNTLLKANQQWVLSICRSLFPSSTANAVPLPPRGKAFGSGAFSYLLPEATFFFVLLDLVDGFAAF